MSDGYTKRKIMITECWNTSPNYKNIKPGTIHTIITHPEGKKNTNQVVWVEGIFRPALILSWEYKFVEVKMIRTKFNTK